MRENERMRDANPKDCPVCDKTFARRDAMKKHLLSIHGPEYVEPDPSRRQALMRRLSHFKTEGKTRAARLMKNPVEVTAPVAGKIRVRSIREGAPSKDEEEEGSEEFGESEVPIATVRGPPHGPAAVPTVRPRKTGGPGDKSKRLKVTDPDIPEFANGAIVRFGGDHFRVSDGRLKWVVFPRDNGTKLEEGDRFRIGTKTFEIVREESPLGLGSLGLFVSLKAKEITESPNPSRKSVTQNRAEESEEEEEQPSDDPDEEDKEDEEEEPQVKPKHSANPWLAPFFGGNADKASKPADREA